MMFKLYFNSSEQKKESRVKMWSVTMIKLREKWRKCSFLFQIIFTFSYFSIVLAVLVVKFRFLYRFFKVELLIFNLLWIINSADALSFILIIFKWAVNVDLSPKKGSWVKMWSVTMIKIMLKWRKCSFLYQIIFILTWFYSKCGFSCDVMNIFYIFL